VPVRRSLTLAGRDLTRIGLGTNRLRNTPKQREFLRAAAEAGVGMVDTAHVYTSGESERTVGDALGSLPDGPLVATKGGYEPGSSHPDVLRSQVEESLERLGADSIELYYLHRVHPGVPIEESLGVLKEYSDDGRIGHVGISAVGIEEIERARQVLPIAAVQNHYNRVDRDYDDVIDYCEEQGIVFVPYYPLHSDRSRGLAETAARHRATEQQIALAWLLRRSPAIFPIPGTLSIEHLRENVAALEIELTDDEYASL
jgi:pyridoxine 4-dehydrogenase